MKYVKFENGSFIIFPETIGHKEIVVNGMFTGKPVLAGTINIGVQNGELAIDTYGESIGLKLKADEKDGEYIKVCCIGGYYG